MRMSSLVALGCLAGAFAGGSGCHSSAVHSDGGAGFDLSLGGSGGGGGAGSTGGDGGPSSGHWVPAAGTTFFWDLVNTPPDNSRNVGAYDIDGFGNDAAEVAALHAQGKRVVCYMDAGTYEPGRPDSSQFPAALLGSDVVGWPGEKWLDIRPGGPNYATLQSIMSARFAQCQMKGFDAVEPDNIDSYANSAGFNATAADQLTYDEWIATTVHGLGLAVFQKNDLDQVPQLIGDFDGILDEECNKYTECTSLAPYSAAHKPVWDAEYTDDGETTAMFCVGDVSAAIVGALYSTALDGSVFQPCSDDVGLVN
jgi:hypothetical protein